MISKKPYEEYIMEFIRVEIYFFAIRCYLKLKFLYYKMLMSILILRERER